jgi:hypothetical protein
MISHEDHDLIDQVKSSVNLLQVLKLIGNLFNSRKKVREDGSHHLVERLVMNCLLLEIFSFIFDLG